METGRVWLIWHVHVARLEWGCFQDGLGAFLASLPKPSHARSPIGIRGLQASLPITFSILAAENEHGWDNNTDAAASRDIATAQHTCEEITGGSK
jgi:hypothetical protein